MAQLGVFRLARLARRNEDRMVKPRAILTITSNMKSALPCCLLAVAATLFPTFVQGADKDGFTPKQQIEFYEKQILPILSEQCYKCHSHQADKIKGSLVLDSRAGLLKGGETGPAIMPGEPEK